MTARIESSRKSALDRTNGMVPAIIGCIFAVLGIFTLGFLFVPIAILCSVIGLLRSVTRFSLGGFALSILSCILSVVGIVSSPALLLILAGMFGAQ